jgi:hypothetical protein
MAIAIISEVPQGNLDMYDAVNVKLEEGGPLPVEGHVFHCVGAMEGGGFRVIDVWESQSQFEDFVQNRLGPAINEVAGGEGPEPDRAVYELHNVRTA